MLCDHITRFPLQSKCGTHDHCSVMGQGKLGGRTTWGHMPVQPLSTCGAFGKLLDLSTPQFPKF